MAKQRLFPEPQKDDKRAPHEKFADVASKVFSVPKAEIDEREKQWRNERKRSRRKKDC
jgi:hypothetical protein